MLAYSLPALRKFLPALFGDEYDKYDPHGEFVCLLVKYAGLKIPDPTASTKSNYDASILICSHLLATLWGVDGFRSSDHVATIHNCNAKLHIHNQERCDLDLESIVSALSCNNRMTILQGKEIGQRLSVLPSMVNGNVLLAQEYKDALLLHYARSPASIQSYCDSWGQKFSVRHALRCKKGGLMILSQ
jgi:hypothetical protein